MTEFIASNGVRIKRGEHHVNVWSPRGTKYIGGSDGVFGIALLEYLDHVTADSIAKRDAALGRWRFDNDRVVYPAHDGNTVIVLAEKYGQTNTMHRHSLAGHSDWVEPARAYFDAHPEPQPWHDATAGEVWVLTIDGNESAFYPSKSLDRCFTPVAPETGRTAVGMDSLEITDGHRIYPEGNE